MTTHLHSSYTVRWVGREGGIDPTSDNVDVFVEFSSGERYVATFFTPQNIQLLLEKNARTGECAGGLYVWSTHMVVVRELTREAVERVVADLLTSGEFRAAFAGPYMD